MRATSFDRPPVHSRPGPRRRGFTLVELIAVMLLVGVLATVAIPRLDGAFALRGAGWRDQLQAGLLQGLPAHMPAAIVQHASLPQQRLAVTTLGALAQTVAEQGLGSPAVLVIGDVLAGLLALQTAAAPHGAVAVASAVKPAIARRAA